MTLTINDDCTILTMVSEEGIVSDIISPESTDCCIILEVGTNCCTPTISTSLPMLYDFDYDVTACSVNTVLNPDQFTLSIEILGIEPSCVSVFTYKEAQMINAVTESNPTDLIFTHISNSYSPSGDFEFTVDITTCGGLIYNLEFTINISGGCGSLVLGTLVAIYPIPSVPAGVTIVGANTIEITPEAFGISGSVFPDGIYYVGLTETTTTDIITEDDSIFVNCGTTCRIIDFISQNLCSDVYVIFDALRLSDNCDVTTYQSKCDLWYYVGKELGYFTDTPCAEISTCKFC